MIARRLEHVERPEKVDLRAADRVGPAGQGQDAGEMDDGVAIRGGAADLRAGGDIADPPLAGIGSALARDGGDQSAVLGEIEDS